MKMDYKQVILIYSNSVSEISDVSHQLHAITGCDDMLDTLNLDRFVLSQTFLMIPSFSL